MHVGWAQDKKRVNYDPDLIGYVYTCQQPNPAINDAREGVVSYILTVKCFAQHRMGEAKKTRPVVPVHGWLVMCYLAPQF